MVDDTSQRTTPRSSQAWRERLIPDETTVVARARDGSTTAFETLIDHYQTPLFRYAYRLLNDRHDAEDVVQDTFIGAWRGLPTLGDAGAFRGWLYQIATRRIFDLLRARRPMQEWPDEDAPPPSNVSTAAVPHDPARVVVQRAQFEALQQALATLAPQQRAAWSMHKIDGLSYDEIAVAMALPVSTVRGRIARARQGLAERMASWR